MSYVVKYNPVAAYADVNGEFTVMVVKEKPEKGAKGITFVTEALFNHVMYYCKLHSKFIEENKARWFEDNHHDAFTKQIAATTQSNLHEVSNALWCLEL